VTALGHGLTRISTALDIRPDAIFSADAARGDLLPCGVADAVHG